MADEIVVPSVMDKLKKKAPTKKRQRTDDGGDTIAAAASAVAPVQYGTLLADGVDAEVESSLFDEVTRTGTVHYALNVDVAVMLAMFQTMKQLSISDTNVFVGFDVGRHGISAAKAAAELEAATTPEAVAAVKAKHAALCCKTDDPHQLGFYCNDVANTVLFMATMNGTDPFVQRVLGEDGAVAGSATKFFDGCCVDVSDMVVSCNVAMRNRLDAAAPVSYVMFDDDGKKYVTMQSKDGKAINTGFKAVEQCTETVEKDTIASNNFEAVPNDLLIVMDLSRVYDAMHANNTKKLDVCAFTLFNVDDKFLQSGVQLLLLKLNVESMTYHFWLATKNKTADDGETVWEEAPPPKADVLKRIPKTALKLLTRHSMLFSTFHAVHDLCKSLGYGKSLAKVKLSFNLVKEDSTDTSMCMAMLTLGDTIIRIFIGSVSADTDDTE